MNCLGERHELKKCTSIRNCNKCGGRHHTALGDKGDVRVSKPSSSASVVAGNSVSATTACASSFGQLMLKTATVIVNGPNGNETSAILFADDGSRRPALPEKKNSQHLSKDLRSNRVFSSYGSFIKNYLPKTLGKGDRLGPNCSSRNPKIVEVSDDRPNRFHPIEYT